MTALEPGKVVYPGVYHTVETFLTEHERWEGPDSHIRTTGEYGSETRYTLLSKHLRGLLRYVRSVTEQLEAERRKVADLKTELEQSRKGGWRP